MARSIGASGGSSVFVANRALEIVLGLVLANLLFNAVATAAGLGFPFTSFLFRPSDRFADFLKLSFSYPGLPVHSAAKFWGLNELLAHHQWDVARHEGTQVNHFHVPPLPTLFALAARAVVQWVDPVALFLSLLIVTLFALFMTVLRLSPPGRAGAALASVALFCYPTLLAIDRGHFFSLFCATLTIAATLRTLRDGRAEMASLLMFAIAVNIRPNAGIIPFALWLGKKGISFRQAMALGMLAFGLFWGGLLAAHLIYPAYSFSSFLSGLRDYTAVYAAGDIGYPYGSSLHGLFRALFEFGSWMYVPPLIVGGILLAAAIFLSWQGRLRHSECIFLVASAYALGSHVFADYHLLVFVIPLVLLATEHQQPDRSTSAILLASSLVLAPKNFFFTIYGNVLAWSWQVVANPIILLLASLVVVAAAARRGPSNAPEAVPVAA